VLCAPVVRSEAQQQGKSVIAHYAHLIVHGVLHLHGMDHENDDEAHAMEARETAILARLGFADPYLEMEQI
jgi:probable rRNA maturation factor